MEDLVLVLRPARTDDLWLFERQLAEVDAAGSFNWAGFTDIGSVRRKFDTNGLLGPDGGHLVILGPRGATGTVQWRRMTYGMPDWWCWNIGITLLPEYRGRGIGARAQSLLVSYLFNTTAVERIEAYTDIDNVAEQRSLEKAGFVREGVLRRVQFRSGRWRDLVLYSLLREEHPA